MTIRLKVLEEQVMVITGASSGIGLVTAKAAAAAGAAVLLVARNEATLQAAVAEIRAAGGVADHVVADVGDAAAVEAAAARAVALYGRIDTWVNDAGGAIYAKLVDTPLDEHERLFRTNYFGVVNGTIAALRHMRDRGGAIITVGSIASDLQTPILGAYAASKHAVKGFVASLRLELIADGIPVALTLVKPAGIDTPIAQHAVDHIGGGALIPPPVYDPALVAKAILDAAQHVRRDVTVGGLGRAQVLFGVHFPGLLDRLAGAVLPRIVDADGRKTDDDTLFAPAGMGQARSERQPGRTTSLYTAAERHPAMTRIAAAAMAVGIAGLLWRRKSTA